jgi:hypothetical protein
MQLSPAFHYFHSLGSTHAPQRPVLKYAHSISLLWQPNLSYRGSLHSMRKSHVYFLLLSSFQRTPQRPCVTFRNKLFLFKMRTCYTHINLQVGRPPLVGFPRMLIQNIRSYFPYVEIISSIYNLRTRHAVVTRDQLNKAYTSHIRKNDKFWVNFVRNKY